MDILGGAIVHLPCSSNCVLWLGAESAQKEGRLLICTKVLCELVVMLMTVLSK